MKKYQYRYITDSLLQPAVEWHFFKFRAIPCCNEFQQTEIVRFDVLPSCQLTYGTDGQGNAVQWGSFSYVHAEFHVISEGVVIQSAPYVIHEVPADYYRVPTRLTSCSSDADRSRVLNLGLPSLHSPFEVALAVMHFVHSFITYTPCHTTVATTAAEILADPRGVCQDYAHLMIALCRDAGIHARYVSGLIAGEGQTHAWVEVSDGSEWRAFDPTHDQTIEWGYIKIAHGRDANDCPTNRGRFYAWTNERQTVFCKLTEQ